MIEDKKSEGVLSDLLLHVKNRPELHPLPLIMQKMVRGNDVADYSRYYDEMKAWFSELVGKTQKLSLSIAGKEASLRKQFIDLIDDIPIDMQKVGENYEVYSVGTKKQWIDWLVHYNKVLSSNGDNLESVEEKESELRKQVQELQYHIVDYLLKTCVFGRGKYFEDINTLSEEEWNIINTTMTLSELLGREMTEKPKRPAEKGEDSPSHRLLRTCCPSQYDKNEESSIYKKRGSQQK